MKAEPTIGKCNKCGKEDLAVNMNWNSVTGYACYSHFYNKMREQYPQLANLYN